MSSSLTTLVGGFLDLSNSQIHRRCISVYCNLNNHVYGIIRYGKYIYKFNPVDKSCTTIDIPPLKRNIHVFGGTYDEKGGIYCKAKWKDGVVTKCGIVKIDTTRGDAVTLLLGVLQPHQHFTYILGTTRGVLGLDGHIYYMPKNLPGKMIKLDTDRNTFECVGGCLEYGEYYWWAVRGADGCIYGIPRQTRKIMKYNPVTKVTSLVGEEYNSYSYFYCGGNGALAKNGCIYAFSNSHSWILKINTNQHDENDTFVAWEWITNFTIPKLLQPYGDAILGLDGCIYWPPNDANYTLYHNPLNGHTSIVGHDLGTLQNKYYGGALAPDGAIYCMPWHAAMVLAIDPFRVFQETLPSYMIRNPREKFGSLFDHDGEGITYFDSAIIKYGRRGFEAVIKHLPVPNNCQFSNSNLYPFVAAALCPNCALSVVYYLLRQAPALIQTTTIPCNIVGSHSDDDTPLNKKQRIHGQV